MTSIALIVLLAIDIAFWIVLIHIIMSWLITFNVLNMSQPLVYQIWSGLNRLLEPIYGPIRRMLPNTGGLDLAPLIFIFALYALEIVIRNNILAFA